MLFKSPQDRFTWLVLFVVFVSALVSVGLNYHIIRQLQAQQQSFHDQNLQVQNTIIRNQKVYINCLISINPQGDIKMQEKVCFNQSL